MGCVWVGCKGIEYFFMDGGCLFNVEYYVDEVMREGFCYGEG